ncbi:MAG: GDP-mannose 4,6-dehydratase [Enterocloster sp.]
MTPTRDFNYVKDTANGFIEIYKSEKTVGEEINIATQKEVSIGALAEELICQINPYAHIICDEERLRPEKSEVNRLLGSNEKIHRLTNWTSQYTLAEGLKETIEFLRNNMDKYKVDIYNL